MASPAAAPAASGVAARTVNLVKVYGEGEAAVTALKSVTAEFASHRFTAVMGPSGSGKSTLMHCVAGLDSPTSGEVWVGPTELSKLDDKALTLMRREQLGFVFQQYNLIPTLTAGENITLPLDIAGTKVDDAWLAEVVKAVRLEDRLTHRPAELSGGQQQRVACARALITRPSLVLADEPTGNLDSSSSADVLSFLRRSVDELGQSVVIVTHDATAASYADSVMFLADGEVVDTMANPTADKVLDKLKSLDRAKDA
ncbi:MAG TPA: ABC transporter ATP-binding protein [Mycobacteriales bacterium]|nr:ABC transporter ATP-binding protein [Mycobacteriales bacterium]